MWVITEKRHRYKETSIVHFSFNYQFYFEGNYGLNIMFVKNGIRKNMEKKKVLDKYKMPKIENEALKLGLLLMSWTGQYLENRSIKHDIILAITFTLCLVIGVLEVLEPIFNFDANNIPKYFESVPPIYLVSTIFFQIQMAVKRL